MRAAAVFRVRMEAERHDVPEHLNIFFPSLFEQIISHLKWMLKPAIISVCPYYTVFFKPWLCPSNTHTHIHTHTHTPNLHGVLLRHLRVRTLLTELTLKLSGYAFRHCGKLQQSRFFFPPSLLLCC